MRYIEIMEHITKMTDMSVLGAFIEESLKNGKEVNLTVTGNSMYPLFKSRVDTVVLTVPKKIKKYDILFYKRPDGSYILHRILKIKNGIMTIAGDNETVKEYPVEKSQAIGVVKTFTRKGKIYSVNELWYKFYSFIWCRFFPFRFLMLRGIFTLGKIKARIKRGVKKT